MLDAKDSKVDSLLFHDRCEYQTVSLSWSLRCGLIHRQKSSPQLQSTDDTRYQPKERTKKYTNDGDPQNIPFGFLPFQPFSDPTGGWRIVNELSQNMDSVPPVMVSQILRRQSLYQDCIAIEETFLYQCLEQFCRFSFPVFTQRKQDPIECVQRLLYELMWKQSPAKVLADRWKQHRLTLQSFVLSPLYLRYALVA